MGMCIGSGTEAVLSMGQRSQDRAIRQAAGFIHWRCLVRMAFQSRVSVDSFGDYRQFNGELGLHRQDARGRCSFGVPARVLRATRQRVGLGQWRVTERSRLGDRDAVTQVDILDGVEQCHALGPGLLEGLSSADEPHAAGTLVDDGGLNRLL
jgi:hypothetical protein